MPRTARAPGASGSSRRRRAHRRPSPGKAGCCRAYRPRSGTTPTISLQLADRALGDQIDHPGVLRLEREDERLPERLRRWSGRRPAPARPVRGSGRAASRTARPCPPATLPSSTRRGAGWAMARRPRPPLGPRAPPCSPGRSARPRGHARTPPPWRRPAHRRARRAGRSRRPPAGTAPGRCWRCRARPSRVDSPGGGGAAQRVVGVVHVVVERARRRPWRCRRVPRPAPARVAPALRIGRGADDRSTSA